MANQNKTDIGLIGLAVMGENLALNMESKGWHVSVYNRTVPGVEEGVVDRFMNGRAKGKNIEGFTDIKAFVDSIAIPRKIMMMVRAGSPVDELMDQLFPLLSPGDILIDGGNSNYEDTNRRVKLAESKGFLFVGSGVSGGEEGALNGASIMPGGSEKAWPEVKPILQSIAAKAPDGTPCCQWVGPAGSGHFVKMIHNGIEYGDMQLIAEAYWVMKKLLDLTNEEMADVFARWNEGKLRSYLIEITANILRHKDKSGGYLIDKILDAAGQKGTGKWSVINAMELGMPLGLIATAVFERSLSAQKDLRHLASRQYQCQHTQPIYNKVELVKNIFSALYASKLVSYAQGFAVLQRASDAFDWHLDLASIARMWRGGCIIRRLLPLGQNEVALILAFLRIQILIEAVGYTLFGRKLIVCRSRDVNHRITCRIGVQNIVPLRVGCFKMRTVSYYYTADRLTCVIFHTAFHNSLTKSGNNI